MRTTYAYEPVSDEEMAQATTWLQRRLNLLNWSIALELGPRPKWLPKSYDDALGSAFAKPEAMVCNIWVDVRSAKKDNQHPLQLLAHEMVHLLLEQAEVVDYDKGLVGTQDQICYFVDSLLYEAYCREHSRPIARPWKLSEF